MKKFWVALLSCGLSATMLFGIPVSAIHISQDTYNTVQPYYEEISYIIADISINNGFVAASGSYRVRLDNPKITMTITLQKSTNGTTWSTANYWGYKYTTDWGQNEGLFKAEEKNFYRTKVELDVYDSNGNYIESGDVYSSIVYYRG